MRKSSSILILCLLTVLPALTLKAQDITVQLGNDEVGLNELFTITVTLKNGSIKNYTDFPEIDGFAKRGTKDKLRFYNIAQGSAQELRYFIILTNDLGYQNLKAGLLEKLDEVGKLLSSYMSKIHSNS